VSDVDTQTQITPSLSSAGLHDSNAFTLGEPIPGFNIEGISPLSGFNVGRLLLAVVDDGVVLDVVVGVVLEVVVGVVVGVLVVVVMHDTSLSL
jgi:hypothetical protein